MMIHLSKKNYDRLNVAFEAYRLFSDNRLEIVLFYLNHEEQIELHSMPVKVVFYVLEGKGVFLHQNDEFPVQKGDILVVEPNTLRGWKCLSKHNITVVAIKQL